MSNNTFLLDAQGQLIDVEQYPAYEPIFYFLEGQDDQWDDDSDTWAAKATQLLMLLDRKGLLK